MTVMTYHYFGNARFTDKLQIKDLNSEFGTYYPEILKRAPNCSCSRLDGKPRSPFPGEERPLPLRVTHRRTTVRSAYNRTGSVADRYA